MVANPFLEQYVITPSDQSVCDAPDAAKLLPTGAGPSFEVCRYDTGTGGIKISRDLE